MSADFSPDLRAELLDDFYAECDDQLANFRLQVGRLESALAAETSDPTALESLYRGVHTFKGNSAIVGLGLAEELAHATEDVLRRLTRGEPLTPQLLALIAQAGHMLEQAVTAYRHKQRSPDTSALLVRLRAGTPPAPPPALAGIPPARVLPKDASPAVRLAWHATFTPSSERSARGVDVSAIRRRLGELGEILTVNPTVKSGGHMTFEFSLALRAPPEDAAGWAADGLEFRAGSEPPAPTPAETRESADSSMSIAPSHIVRVDLGRLDELMRITGELVIHRSRLEEQITRMAGDRAPLQELNHAFGRLLRQLREGITRVRLVPMADIFNRLPFVMRDLTLNSDKKIKLVVEGHETEVDKYVVERLKEPLLHLVRNAATHGIESPAERIARGKPPEATLRLRAQTAGAVVVIQIRDDGGGIDAARVAEKAAALGLPVPADLTGAALLDLICASGLSTRDEADRAAGRGLGMAVVADTVRELGGSLTLETEPGQGTEFTLRLPLTLSIADTLLVSVGTQMCAVPQAAIEEIFQLPATEVRVVQRVELLPYRSGLLPLTRLRTHFGLAPAGEERLSVLVVGSDRGLAGLVVDRVHGQREVVVRPMRDPLLRVPGISGATELGDGKPVLILDAVALTSGAVRVRSTAPGGSGNPHRERPSA